MDKVDVYISALDKLPKDNGRNLTWEYALAVREGQDCVIVTMQDRWANPNKYYQRFILFDHIYEMDDPESAAAKVIEIMYDEAGEHNNTEKLLMSPEEAAGILREFAKDFEECGDWDFVGNDIDDEDLITAINVAIKCLEVTL